MSNRRSGRLDTSQNYGNQQYIANNNRPNPSSYAARQIRPPGQTENTTATNNNPPLPRLPKGWRRYVDETSRLEYYWNETNIDIILKNKAENNEVKEKIITNFFKKIGVGGLSTGNVKRIMK